MDDPLPCSQGIRTPHMCGIARRRVFPCRRLRQPRRVLRHLARQPSAPVAPCVAWFFRHDRDLTLSRTTRRATTWFRSRRNVLPASAVSRARGSWPSVVRPHPPPPARYRERGVRCLCDASTAYAALLQRRHLLGTLQCHLTRRALRPGNVALGDSDCGAR